MKKLINAPERVVEDMLRGMGLAHGGPDPDHPREPTSSCAPTPR